MSWRGHAMQGNLKPDSIPESGFRIFIGMRAILGIVLFVFISFLLVSCSSQDEESRTFTKTVLGEGGTVDIPWTIRWLF